MTIEILRKICVAAIAASVLTAPGHAASWQQSVSSDFQTSSASVRTGAFVGARFVTSLGPRTSARAQISLAPTISRTSGNGMVSTKFGEGLALNFGARARPSLTIAGTRADVALGLNQRGSVDGENKLGISTGGWVAIGLVTAAVVGYVAFAAYVREKEEGAD